MSFLSDVSSADVACRLGWTLLHSLWQCAVAAVVLSVALQALRRRSANARYIVACAGMVTMFAGFVATFLLLPSLQENGANTVSAATDGYLEGAPTPDVSERPIGEPAALAPGHIRPDVEAAENPNALDLGQGDTGDRPEALVSTAKPKPGGVPPSLTERATSVLAPWLPWIAVGWLLGVLWFSVWNVGGWITAQRLRLVGVSSVEPDIAGRISELVQRMKVSRPVRLLRSAVVEAPITIGWLRPTILLPLGLITGLTPSELDAIIIHELAHIRRHDYLVNLLQTVIETLLFYHPAVWWVSRRIRIERENCCDDWAVAVSGDSLSYARTLTRFGELRHTGERKATVGQTVSASGGSLLSRVRRLLPGPRDDAARPRTWLAGGAILATVVFLAVMISYMSPPAGVASSATAADADADESAAWGDAFNGVQARLRVKKAVWAANETPTLYCDLRHNGRFPQSWAIRDVEVDGAWYWVLDKPKQEQVIAPDQTIWDVPLALNSRLRHADLEALFRLRPGNHTVRARFAIGPFDPNSDVRMGPGWDVVTNPVEITVERGEEKPAATEAFTVEDIAERVMDEIDVGAMVDLDVVPATAAKGEWIEGFDLRLFSGFGRDGRERPNVEPRPDSGVRVIQLASTEIVDAFREARRRRPELLAEGTKKVAANTLLAVLTDGLIAAGRDHGQSEPPKEPARLAIVKLGTNVVQGNRHIHDRFHYRWWYERRKQREPAQPENDVSFVVPLGNGWEIRIIPDPEKLEGAWATREGIARRCRQLLPRVKNGKYGEVVVAELHERPAEGEPWLPPIEWKLKDLATFEVHPTSPEPNATENVGAADSPPSGRDEGAIGLLENQAVVPPGMQLASGYVGEKIQFGPVVERELKDGQFFDFATGRICTPPVDLDLADRAAMLGWATRSGADARFMFDRGARKMQFLDTWTAYVQLGDPNQYWSDLAPEALRKNIMDGWWGGVRLEEPPEIEAKTRDVNRDLALTILDKDLPWTHIFMLSNGHALGVLQVTAVAEDPPSIKIRYRLLVTKEEGKDQAVAQAAGARFVMPQPAYKRALESHISTAPRYVLVTIADSSTGKSREACVEPRGLLGAIHREKGYARDTEGWDRTTAFALAQKDRIFRFSDSEAYKRASPRYTPKILAEVRQRVNGMTANEIITEIGDQQSDLYRFCVEGREGAYPYLDSVAHVLMERGIACGRSCKPGLLDIYGKMDDQQESSPKTEDLSDRLKIEAHGQDNLPGGLYAVGPYDADEGQSPDAHQLYQWRVEKKISDGYERLVGRLPVYLYGLGLKGGAALEVLEFTCVGNRLSGTLRYTLPLKGAKLSANSVYLSASLPKLPPGRYEVEISFKDHYQTGDGKVFPADEGTLPKIRPMTCKFHVPEKDVAAEAVPGDPVDGLKCSIGVLENSLRVGDEIRIDATFENVSDKPISFAFPPDYAAKLLRMRDEKGRAVVSRMTGITEGWMHNKPFRTLQPGGSFAVAFAGKIAFRPASPRREAQPEPALSIDFHQDAMLFTLQTPGSFTVALRLTSDEEAAGRLRKQGLETVWQGAVSSNVARFQVKAATREELDAAIETLRGDAEAKRRESIRLLGAHMDTKAVPALLEIVLKGSPELKADAAGALGAISDSSIVPALVAEYRKAGSVQDRQRILGIIEAASDWTQQWPLYLEIARSGGSYEETSRACSRLTDLGRPEVVPLLIERAKSGGPMVQRGAMDQIAQMLEFHAKKLPGQATAGLKGELLGILKQDGDSSVRSRAAQALAKASGEDVVPALLEALKDPDAFVGSYAAHSLGRIAGPDAILALEAYMQAAPRESQKRAAQEAIERIRERAKSASQPAATATGNSAQPGAAGRAPDTKAAQDDRQPSEKGPVTFREILAARPAPDLTRLAARSVPTYDGPDATDSFYDILKLRGVGRADAVPVLEQIVAENLESSRIHGFAAAQALFCIGTPKAYQVLSKHLLTGQYRAGLAINYTFHWDMAEPQRSRFIGQYLLKNLSDDLVVELQQRASPEEDEGRLDFLVTLRNASQRPFHVVDRTRYSGKMLFFRAVDGSFARSGRMTAYYYGPDEWIELKPGQTHQYPITLHVKPADEIRAYDRSISRDSSVLLETQDMRWDIGKPGRYEVVAMFEAAPLTEAQRKQVEFDNAWSGRAVSKPIQVDIPAPAPPNTGAALNADASDKGAERTIPAQVALEQIGRQTRLEKETWRNRWEGMSVSFRLSTPASEIRSMALDVDSQGNAVAEIWEPRKESSVRYESALARDELDALAHRLGQQRPWELHDTAKLPGLGHGAIAVSITVEGESVDIEQSWPPPNDRRLTPEDAQLVSALMAMRDAMTHVIEVVRRDAAIREDGGTVREQALPGSRLSLEAAMKPPPLFVAVCEAVDQAEVIYHEKGVGEATQQFRVIESLSGEPSVSKMVVVVHYTRVEQPHLDPPEQPIQKGQRVIWICREKKPKWREGFEGVKPLHDTPENRKLIDSLSGQLYDDQRLQTAPLVLSQSSPSPPGTRLATGLLSEEIRFGPVVERAMNGAPSREDRFIDLDTGRFCVPPDDLNLADDAAVSRWAEQNHVDAQIEHDGNRRGMRSFGGYSAFVDAENPSEWWESQTPKSLRQNLLNGMFRSATMDMLVDSETAEPRTPQTHVTPWTTEAGDLPMSIEFVTSTDGFGVLQIVAFTEDPPGIKIRYRLLLTVDDVKTPASPAKPEMPENRKASPAGGESDDHSKSRGEQRSVTTTATRPSPLARNLADSLPTGWRLTESGRRNAPAEWSGKTDCEYLKFAHATLKPDAGGFPQATLAVWLTPRDYVGRRLPHLEEQPGGAWLYGQSRDHLLLLEVVPLADPHWSNLEATFQKCGFARLDESEATPAAEANAALPDTPESRKAIQSVPGPAEAGLERALPGSRLSIEEAVNRWTAFAVACEATKESKEADFAHLIPGSAKKWHRYRWDVVLRDGRGPSEPFLSYRVWTLQDGPERPVAKGERVIWIGVNPNPGNYRGVKALPDTRENRQAVRAAFAKRPASANKYVAFPEYADAEQAAQRVALLKRNLDTFRFVFRAMLLPNKPRRFVALRVARGKDSSPWEKSAIQITRQQATRIIDHLAAEGLFFRRAGNVIKDTAFEPDTVVHTIWLIDNENNPEAIFVERIQYGKEDRIRAIRNVLEGDARDAMDGLLAQLESTGQQENLDDNQPDPQDAVLQSGRAPSAETHERLRTSLSPLKLLASDVKYEGEALPRPPDRITGEKIVIDRVAYYRAIMESGLVAEDVAASTTRAYRMFDLAIAAGWYERIGSEYLPQDIRGLYRQGNRLWMGSNGVGVLIYDTKTRTWSRYFLQDAPVPGFHVTVLYGDADYVFATYGYRKEVPSAELSLHVYSTKHERWLRIVAVPTRDALRLGTSKGLPLKVSIGWDHRRFADQPFVPIGGEETPELAHPDKTTRRPDGSYLLRSGHPDTESSWTDLVIRPVDLQADFEHFASVPTTGPVASSEFDRVATLLSLYRSDVSLAQAMGAEDAIRPGDSKQKVISLLGQPRNQHKRKHFWSYFFAYGTPLADSTPLATVTVWFDGDKVRRVEVWFRPARDAVEWAKERLKPGTTAQQVRKQFGRPAKTEGNRWHYSWEYGHNTEFWLDVTFAEDQTVTKVDVRSAHVDPR